MQVMKKIRASPHYEFLLITISTIAIIACLFLIGLKFYGFTSTLTLDSFFYFKMSYTPFESTNAPYMYRILTPLLVFILPLKHIISFTLINLTAITSTSVLFYYYLKKLNFKPLYSFIGVLFFILGPNILYSMYNIALVDPLSFLFFLLAFYAILCKNDKLYFIAIILGILNKETILFTVPLYFLYKLETERLIDALKSTVLILVPVLILFISIRYYFGFTDYLSPATVKEIILYQINSNNILVNPYLTFGVLWIIGLYNIKNIENKFLKNTLYVLPFIFLQIFIATDTLRSLFLAFPIIIPLSLYMFKIKDKKIISIFLIFSIFTIISYLISITDLPTLTNLLFNFVSFLILPSEILVTVILIVLLIKNIPLKPFKNQ